MYEVKGGAIVALVLKGQLTMIGAIVVVVLLFVIASGGRKSARRQEQQMRQLVRAINPEAAAAEDRRERFLQGQKWFVFMLLLAMMGIASVVDAIVHGWH
jgi:hypothetical protein